MLEIKNVSKIYSSKGGVETKALDGVSVSFGETGMVFLLGKSGSGKSTLLNVCGGLDAPTEGEVIVKGKSSKDFTGADFDSYRNTFIGFVFQEYNILDEFNVEDNIALALELQGKPKDREKINSLLKDVDLEQFAKRKPNTLSGGQKQRIAIARALIKDPQIIMADEPTGALDSATGKQVLDALKKLSETRLVIVVSHDREFAEIYGDRIIELKDGKIISDTEKTTVPPETYGENITVTGGNTLSVKCGEKLTEENFGQIRRFLETSNDEVIITRGEREVSAFRKSAKISKDGGTEIFVDTVNNDEPKIYKPSESEFIRSKLPAAKALKIGASGLKFKPFRLFMTIFLSFIALTMFGLLSTLMLYDNDSVAANSFADSGFNRLDLKKYYRSVMSRGDKEYESETNVNFTVAEEKNFKDKFGEEVFGYYSRSDYGEPLANVNTSSVNSKYYMANAVKFAYVPEGNALRKGLVGGYPQSADEVCISSYLADAILASDLYAVKYENGDYSVSTNEKISITGRNDLIGKDILVYFNSNRRFKITGVFESGEIPEKYDGLKQFTDDYDLENNFRQYLSEQLHAALWVSENFYDTYGEVFKAATNGNVNYFTGITDRFTVSGVAIDFNFGKLTYEKMERFTEVYGVNSYSAENLPEAVFFKGKSGDTLKDDEIILNLSYLITNPDSPLKAQIHKSFYDKEIAGGENNTYTAYNKAEYRFKEIKNAYDCYAKGEYTSPENGEKIILNSKERLAFLKKAQDGIKDTSAITVTVNLGDYETFDMKLVGYFIVPEADRSYDYRAAYLSENFINGRLTVIKDSYDATTNYKPERNTVYAGLYIPYDGTADMFYDVLDVIGTEHIQNNDVFYSLNSGLFKAVQSVNEISKGLSTTFLALGLVFMLFSSLLLFNFISVSISGKKKEIGILRAVGARGTDVFKIFFSESGIIVGICTVLALIGSAVACAVLNGILKSDLGLNVTLFVFGFASVALLIGVALFVAFISTFLPVYLAAKKKPVDSIRSL